MPQLATVQSFKQLVPVPIMAPGGLGLNTIQAGQLLSPQYATDTQNGIIDSAGRLGARYGMVQQTSTLAPTAIQSIFEYNQGNGQYQTIVAWGGASGGISTSLVNPAGVGVITGTAPSANGRWFFQNFNNKCIGFQSGTKPIVYTGTGSFAPITESSGSAPTGGVGCSAFGRLWAVQTDLQTIQYCALLDETDWGSSDSGSLDMRTVWSAGTDQVTAIFAFNSALVICGLKHIIFYVDGSGSKIGITPTNMYVFDVITGTGCLSQFTVQAIGQGDVWFVSPVGVQSLMRLMQGSRDNPLVILTKYVRDTLLAQINQETVNNISSTYDSLQGFYLLALPVSGVVYCLDTRLPYTDDAGDRCARVTYWTMTLTALATTHIPQTFGARTTGSVSLYSGNTDDGAQYTYNWQSPWLELGQQLDSLLKMLKRIEATVYTVGGQTVSFGWNTDFGAATGSMQYAIAATGANQYPAQFGLGEFGISQFGGSAAGVLIKIDPRGRGQYYQLSLSSPVTGPFAIAQIQPAFKMGRVAG